MLKKILFNLLSNKWLGALVHRYYGDKVPDLRWRGFQYDLTPLVLSPKLISSVFWGFYESAEKRLVEKYYPGDIDTIELGASIGIVSSHISRKIKNSSFLICVEANPSLLKTLETNIDRHKDQSCKLVIEQCALSTVEKPIEFYLSVNTTASNMSYSENIEPIFVKGKTLSTILKERNLNEYFLVSDIEGAEAQLFWEDSLSLKNCCGIIVELHETIFNNSLISINDMRQRLVNDLNFKEVCRDGNVFFFAKKQ